MAGMNPSDLLEAVSNLPLKSLEAYFIVKLLGPTAKYLGGRGPELAEKAWANIGRIFQNAKEKLGSDIEKDGQVPPRVLRGTINEGAFCEDKIATEYLGGVLASSRRDSSRDDRGVVMNAMIGRLSSYQLRTHYIIYHALKDLFDGTGETLHGEPHVWGFGVLLPLSCYFTAMAFRQDILAGVEDMEVADLGNLVSVFSHTFVGLQQEGLIETWECDETGLACYPSPLGIELFLWAYGYGAKQPREFFNPNLKVHQDESVVLIPGYNPFVGEGTIFVDGEGTVSGYGYVPSSHPWICPLPNRPADAAEA